MDCLLQSIMDDMVIVAFMVLMVVVVLMVIMVIIVFLVIMTNDVKSMSRIASSNQKDEWDK